MYNNELLFADKFLSTLKSFGVDKIPFRNDNYRSGVREMRKYFYSIQHKVNDDVKDIKLLFLNDGEGDLLEAIMSLNDGKGISFELHNPYYEMATIKMSESTVECIMQDEKLDLSNNIVEELTIAFCKGAGLEVNKN